CRIRPSGVVSLLIILTLIAIAFAALGLTEKGQALSLPRGSIRAIIALSLIIIYMITGIFLYKEISIVTDPPLSTEAIRFAQQILTTMSTLVVAVSGFYFGSKSVSVDKPAVEPFNIRVISPSKPAFLPNIPGEEMPIKIEVIPIGEAVRWIVDGDTQESLVQTKLYEFIYTRGQSAKDTVTLTFSLVKNPDKVDELIIRPPPP
ncbi:unnamed protein product, partial [marine sediment metagenome]